MNIQGLDYNTQREQLVMPEYGREVQNMVDICGGLDTKAMRQSCAEAIVTIMERMFPQNHEDVNYKQKLWDHLAIMSDFKLDIDWPYDISQANKILAKPQPMEYPMTKISVRHYGHIMAEVFERLKTMAPGEERDALTKLAANQMKLSLMMWSHGSCDDEKVASDLAKYTDGKIQLDLNTFVFNKIMENEPVANRNNNNRNGNISSSNNANNNKRRRR
ncbi:DUF4290 domain-containing protein [Prevotella sp.]|uniref:DUF4290 domain-containing protein n=1 Tax=Prevotella sp. TaxID=59823 RepID=UPI003DA566A5